LITIVDSSVAVKWYSAEPDSLLAGRLLGRPLAAPDLIRIEVANALRRKVVRHEMKAAQTVEALPHLARNVTLFRAEPFTEMALELSLELTHPIHDCFFLILARALDFPFVTADETLWKRTRESLFADRVILLSDWGPDDGRRDEGRLRLREGALHRASGR
jgi:predicted nucleic acid-binding protein